MWIKTGCLLLIAVSASAAQQAWEAEARQGLPLQRAGRYAEAGGCYRRALALAEAAQPASPLEIATAAQDLASLELLAGRPAEAERLYRRAYDLRAGVLTAQDPRLGVTLHGLAEALHERRRYSEAEGLYRRAAANLEAAFGRSSTAVADVWHNWAELYRDTRRTGQARPLLEGAAAIYEKAAPLSPKLAIILRNLAELEASAGNTAQAEQLFDRSLRICDASLPANHPQTGAILQAYAGFLRNTHRRNEANLMNQRARAILARGILTVDASALAAK